MGEPPFVDAFAEAWTCQCGEMNLSSSKICVWCDAEKCFPAANVLDRFTAAANGIHRIANECRQVIAEKFEPVGGEAERFDELLAAAILLRDDLLVRGERDDDGVIVVNASHGRWARFTLAIDAVRGEPST